eukprot:COSAG06_NODE_19916_length_817_cov_10.775766_2_plen_142_part_00
MVAQPAAEMAAVSSSGEEPAPEVSPEPAQQEQAASPMEAMMAMILQKVGGIQEAVDQVSARTLALEGAMADVSLSDSGGPPNGSGSMSATPMGATSVERLERAPDQGPGLVPRAGIRFLLRRGGWRKFVVVVAFSEGRKEA